MGFSSILYVTKEKEGNHMAGMKNICGKIPLELHAKMRQEIEQREISTQQFIQQVIEEHFTEKGGQVSMTIRTVAVQVSEELFIRFKAAVAKKGCKQKDFLIALIEKAIEEIEAEFGEEKEPATPEEETQMEEPPAEQEEESGEPETGEAEEATETESEEPEIGESEEPEETAEPEAAGAEDDPEGEPEEPAGAEYEEDAGESEEADGIQEGEPEASENEETSEPENADAGEAGQEPDDTAEVA